MSREEVTAEEVAEWLAGVRNYLASAPDTHFGDSVVQQVAKDVYDVIYDRVFLANPGGLAASMRQQLAIYEQRRANAHPGADEAEVVEPVIVTRPESADV